MLRLLKFK